MARKAKAVTMNLAEFAGPSNALPTAPGEGGSGGGFGGSRGGGYGGSRFGGERGERGDRYGDRDRDRGEDEGPAFSRADEADRWRRSGPAASRADDQDRWRGGGGGGSFGDRGSRFGDRDRDRGFGGRDSGADTRPAHLRFGRGRQGEDGEAAPASSEPRFRRPSPTEDGEREGGRSSDRYGGERSERSERGYGGGSRWGDRDRDRDSGYGGGRFARDGGDRDRGYGGGSRYGGYGGSRGGGGERDFGPLPTAPASYRQQPEERPRLALKKPAKDLAAKPQRMEERHVEVADELMKGVVALEEKKTALEAAAEENSTINDKQLIDSLARLKIDDADEQKPSDYGKVLAKSLIDGGVQLRSIVQQVDSNSAPPSLLLNTLQHFQQRKGDKALLALVNAAQESDSAVDVLGVLSGKKSGAELDEFLSKHNLLVLKPVPDVSGTVGEALKGGKAPDAIVADIDAAIDPKIAPGQQVAQVVATHMFTAIFDAADDKTKPDVSVLDRYAPLLRRVAPHTDSDAQQRVLFDGQAAWFAAGQPKSALRTLFEHLYSTELVTAESLDAYRNDTTKRSKQGKMKALLQVNTWITEIQPKAPVVEDEDETDADEELANEYGSGNE